MVTIQMRRLLGETVVLAAVMAGSFGLSTTAASACTGSPNCGGGPPPAAVSTCTGSAHCTEGLPPMAAATVECTNPKCLSGTTPTQATLSECSDPKCLSGIPPVQAARHQVRSACLGRCPSAVAKGERVERA
jgi:hypothetical protein